MLSWIFKKRGGTAVPTAATAPPPVGASPVQTQAGQARKAEDANAEWLPRLQSARGDDAALLQLAQAAPLLDIKLAAVEALAGEEALKQAERAFRSRERKVHQVAKRRLEAAVAQREHRARAQALIAAATALTTEPVIAANRLVALDRDWQALDASLLEEGQRTGFATLRERLSVSVRERGELDQRVQRWAADAARALADLQACGAELSATGTARDIDDRTEAARALRAARPEVPETAAPDHALAAALEAASLAAAAAAARMVAVEVPEPPAEPIVQPVPVETRRASAEQLQRLDAALQTAEGAFAEGLLAGMQPHLNEVDAALAALHGAAPGESLQARLQALQAERARLKGWQQWGGARAREDLMAEAEDLARLTLAAAGAGLTAAAADASDGAAAAAGPAAIADPGAEPGPVADARVPAAAARAPTRAPRLHLKTHADAIQALRARWKELDRTGAPAGQALWQRFDATLHAAYQPVAARQAAQKAAREQNLAAREALLATLDALPANAPDSASADDLAAHWKEQARALDRFQLAWRQLGPLEHTVPSAARGALQQRLRASIDRVEVPLRIARESAEAVRAQLIARAEALVQDLARQPPQRDAAMRVRELQSEWQQQARMVPLQRALETTLWARFKAATDAVFAQREAAFDARDAELAANLAAREALVQRLALVDADAPEAEIRRTVAEAERAWRQPVEVPRAAVGALEARFRAAHAAALQRADHQAQRRWQASCDTLQARLGLCAERERATATDAGDALAARWAALGPLPGRWEQALAERWAQAGAPGPLTGPAMDDLLLRLEAALDLPTPAEWQAARRDLKLRALKEAMEGRSAARSAPGGPAEWLVAALRQGGATELQHERLQALIAALRASAHRMQ
jgi:DNA repair protein SbcC/Rad50